MSENVRLCECGCGADMTGRDPRARYDTDLCRTRDWKARTHYGPQKPLQVRSNGPGRRSGRQISYRKAVRMVTDLMSRPCSRCGACLLSPERAAERHVHGYLPEKQR